MTLNKEGIELLHAFESCRLKAYKCPGGVLTIGYGSTFYEDGTKVKEGDKITQKQADDLFRYVSDQFAVKVRKMILKKLTENQFSALVSFAYNVGIGAFQTSTLRRYVNADPLDPRIAGEFMKWNKAGGKVVVGLTRRRQAEADLYAKV